MTKIFSIRTCSAADDIRIDSAKQQGASKLHSHFGGITAKGSEAEKLVFNTATAYRNIRIHHAVIEGGVLSKFGKVFAAHATLGDVRAYAKVKLSDASVHGKVVSQFGTVLAKQSQLHDVAALSSIALIKSSAGQVKSSCGSIKVEEGSAASISAHSGVNVSKAAVAGTVRSKYGCVEIAQSTVDKVKACFDIQVTNSSAKVLSSEFGKVSVRQTDGEKREISQISAHGEVIAQGSTVGEIALRVDQDEQALLDLTDTTVLGKIVVKMNHAIVFHSISAFWSWLFFDRLEQREVPPKHFDLLIKGTEMPKNIAFEGFETEEITSKTTDEGLLVTGQKKH